MVEDLCAGLNLAQAPTLAETVDRVMQNLDLGDDELKTMPLEKKVDVCFQVAADKAMFDKSSPVHRYLAQQRQQQPPPQQLPRPGPMRPKSMGHGGQSYESYRFGDGYGGVAGGYGRGSAGQRYRSNPASRYSRGAAAAGYRSAGDWANPRSTTGGSRRSDRDAFGNRIPGNTNFDKAMRPPQGGKPSQQQPRRRDADEHAMWRENGVPFKSGKGGSSGVGAAAARSYQMRQQTQSKAPSISQLVASANAQKAMANAAYLQQQQQQRMARRAAAMQRPRSAPSRAMRPPPQQPMMQRPMQRPMPPRPMPPTAGNVMQATPPQQMVRRPTAAGKPKPPPPKAPPTPPARVLVEMPGGRVQVKVPGGKVSGDIFSIETGRGLRFATEVPVGASAGQTIMVKIPRTPIEKAVSETMDGPGPTR